MRKSLDDLLYSHRSYLRPSQVHRIAIDEIDSFLGYLQDEDLGKVTARAALRAEQGLSLEAVLKVVTGLNEACHLWIPCEDQPNAVVTINAYSTALMQGYTQAREAIILNEQERIRGALQRTLVRYNLWLQTSAEVSRVATSTLNLNKFLTASVNLIRGNLGFHAVSLFLLSKENPNVAALMASSSGLEPSVPKKYQRLKVPGASLVSQCLIKGQPLVVSDVLAAEVNDDRTILADSRSIVVLPLISRAKVIGGILIQSVDLAAFNEEDVTRLQTLADQLANAIQNARLYHELEAHSESLSQAVYARTIELQKTKERAEAILNNSPDGILLLGSDGTIELCNPAFYDMFEYNEREIISQPLKRLAEAKSVEATNKLLHASLTEGLTKRVEIVAQRKDETTFNAGMALAAMYTAGELSGFVCSLRDITEQVRAEERIKASLREKEVLLREIHHRVKNNLQVISSLLALQAGYTDDDHANQLFRESQNRVRSMALVHERLYQSHDLARIDFAEYVHELVGRLFRSYVIDQDKVQLEITADAVYLDIDMAIPCGLIINELVSNALKHAFPDERHGKVMVNLRTDSNGLHTIIVRDDGVGFPEGLNVHKTESLGLQLVTSLAGQLNATIGLLQTGGTTFEIRFALPKESEFVSTPRNKRLKAGART
ncbi:MAG: PAS domain-containing protein [Anaerolineae bacterium]|nr:PAS domain-containing protein [Anaerolineae bacterium]